MNDLLNRIYYKSLRTQYKDMFQIEDSLKSLFDLKHNFNKVDILYIDNSGKCVTVRGVLARVSDTYYYFRTKDERTPNVSPKCCLDPKPDDYGLTWKVLLPIIEEDYGREWVDGVMKSVMKFYGHPQKESLKSKPTLYSLFRDYWKRKFRS